MIPTECKMPDLSKLELLQGALMLRLVFTQADARIARKEALFRRVFIRLTDKAITEYSEARKALLDQVQESKRAPEEMQKTGCMIYMFSFSDHIENCVNSVSRLLRLFKRINNDKDAPTIHGKKLIALRNTFEHIDERIQRDEIDANEAIMVNLGGDADQIEIGAHQLTFLELAGIISKLHELASYLIFVSDENRDTVKNAT